ncbi:uncharacterized protein LOC124204384 isoform X3 [Daphnia pulex]|uniref:uncharacterized protein LOC124204384 isoform X3 n=1 Tax=Daphnia pulex TaxID=6669 RepID=UPI001EDCB5C7|nr:uncharacterized protein LOC124204384 isoform X3 [Daphnia pulex]
METIEGKITAISHIIYINPKSLFFEVSLENQRWNIMVTDRNHLTNWKEILVMRQWIKLDELKRVTISGHASSKPISVLETTKTSQLTRIEKAIVKYSLSSNLINYEGKVTDDAFGSSGFYQLDDSLTLCLTYMKLVTSIPIIKKGDTVVVHGAHRLCVRDQFLVLICGRGNLVNQTVHKENEGLFPKSAREDSQDFIQHLALENNHGIGLMFSLYELCQTLCDKLTGILPRENVTRKLASVNQKGVLASLVDHIASTVPVETKRRSLSREFLEHGGGCAPCTKETCWNIDVWPLDPDAVERRCNDRELWVTTTGPGGPDVKNKIPENNPKTASPLYWKHDVAPIDSRSDRLSILLGILSFLNGRWELRDGHASVEVVAVDRDCHQFRDRCVFASKFSVHRECFTVEEDRHHQQQRVYVSIEEFHAASLPLAKPDVVDETNPSTESVRFLALNKSLPQMVYSSDTAIRHVFGFLIVASLHGQSEADRLGDDPKRRKKDESVVESSQWPSSAEGGPANCILLVSQDHPTLSYPALVEGRVYEIRLARRKLLSNPIYLSALKEVPQYALKNHVYLVPDVVAIYPVAYHLPRSESYMRRDVLRAEECLSLDEIGQTVSLRGRIVDRMHMDPRFSSERVGQTYTTHRGTTWLGIPGNKKLILKMGDDRECSFGSRIDVYFNLREGQVYPLGLFVGTEVELTWLCLRKTHKTGRLYCTSTLLTCIRLLKIGRNFGCTVEDGTGQALVFFSGDCCRSWLKLPANVWKILQDNVLPHEGEFVYLSSKSRPPAVSVASQILSLYCDSCVHLRRPLHVIVDKFTNNEVNAGQERTPAYFLRDPQKNRLFCLHVGERDSTLCANELSALGSH